MLYTGQPPVLKKNELCALFFILSCLSIHASPISDTRERRSMQINHGLATREKRGTANSLYRLLRAPLPPSDDPPSSYFLDELSQVPAMDERYPDLYVDEELEEEPRQKPAMVKRLWQRRSYRPTTRRYQTLSFLQKRLESRYRRKSQSDKKSHSRPCYWNVISCF